MDVLIPLLETLPGWPTAPAVTPIEWLLLLMILPLALGFIVMLIGMGPSWRREYRESTTSSEVALREE